MMIECGVMVWEIEVGYVRIVDGVGFDMVVLFLVSGKYDVCGMVCLDLVWGDDLMLGICVYIMLIFVLVKVLVGWIDLYLFDCGYVGFVL